MPTGLALAIEDRGSILVKSNEELIKRDEETAQKEAQKIQSSPFITSLANHVLKAWQAAKDEKTDIEEALLRSKRQRDGIYDPEKLAAIKAQGQSEVFIKLTDIKCRAVEAWLKSVYQDSGRPWAITPSPIPNLPYDIEEAIAKDVFEKAKAYFLENSEMVDPAEEEELFDKISQEVLKETQKQADIDAEELGTEIEDDLVEGKWNETLTDVIYDIVTYPTGFIEGPIFRNKDQLEWSEAEGGSYPVVVNKTVAEYDRLSPFDVYPAPGAKNLEEGDLCVKYRYTRSQLSAMKGIDGYDTPAINLVLEHYDAGSMLYEGRVENERASLEDRNRDELTRGNYIEAIKFIGSIPGKLLIEWGLPENVITDKYKEYQGICVLAGNVVISARLNPDPLGRKNVYGASFIKSNDSPWGTSVPEAMADIQEICNGCARAIVTNASLASGPQVWVNASKVKPGTDLTSIHAWKQWIYEFDETTQGSGPPMEFFQPQPIIDALLKLYDYFFNQASEVTGIPTYIYGSSDTSGAAETASGLSMLMNAASKVLQAVALNIDNGIIKPSVEAHWLHIMLSQPERARGDTSIMPRASGYLIQSEALNMRQQEWLNNTANELDMSIIGVPGRAEVLREVTKKLKLPDNVVPSREDILQGQQDEAQAQIEEIIMGLSAQLQISPEELMALAQEPPPEQLEMQEPGMQQPDGSPMGGLQLVQ